MNSLKYEVSLYHYFRVPVCVSVYIISCGIAFHTISVILLLYFALLNILNCMI